MGKLPIAELVKKKSIKNNMLQELKLKGNVIAVATNLSVSTLQNTVTIARIMDITRHIEFGITTAKDA